MLSKRAVETVRVLIKAIAFAPALGFAVYHKELDSLFLSTSKICTLKTRIAAWLGFRRGGPLLFQFDPGGGQDTSIEIIFVSSLIDENFLGN